MDLCLDSFNENDNLKNYVFESEIIKNISFEFEGVIEWKESLRITRKPKNKGLVFRVESEHFDLDFKEKEKAIEFFKNRVDELKFLVKKTKENIVFDGRRYFWKINDNDEVIERVI